MLLQLFEKTMLTQGTTVYSNQDITTSLTDLQTTTEIEADHCYSSNWNIVLL